MKPANYAPVYAGLYPELAEIARRHGYAMAVHGSFAKDADLICVPWVHDAAEPQKVVDAILSEFVMRSVGEPKVREHDRLVYSLTIAAPAAFVDLSFTPRRTSPVVEEAVKAEEADWQDIATAKPLELVWCFEPHDEGGFMFAGYLQADGRWRNNLDAQTQTPTHWQPLPAHPARSATP